MPFIIFRGTKIAEDFDISQHVSWLINKNMISQLFQGIKKRKFNMAADPSYRSLFALSQGEKCFNI
jgi:hypothetical protein